MSSPAYNLIHLKDGTPSPPSGYRNVKWQKSSTYGDTVTINNQTVDVTAVDVSAYEPNIGGVDARTTTTETIAAASRGKLVTLSNGSAVAVTLDSTVSNDFYVFIENEGAGTATLTPSSGNIDGSASLALTTNQGVVAFFDGTNWFTERGMGSGGGGGPTKADIQNEAYTYILDTGSGANVYAATLSPAVTSYVAGLGVAFKAIHTNTGASTLNVNALGTKTLKKWVSGNLVDLVAGDITNGQVIYAKYDGTYFQVLGGLTLQQMVIGFVMNTGVTGTNVGPSLCAPRAGYVTKCKIVTHASDGSTDLTIKIKQNGSDVFSADPTVGHGTSSGTVTTSTSLTSVPLPIAADDVFTIDISSGTSSWVFTAQLE
jgi:hypothetical protein